MLRVGFFSPGAYCWTASANSLLLPGLLPTLVARRVSQVTDDGLLQVLMNSMQGLDQYRTRQTQHVEHITELTVHMTTLCATL